MTQSQVSIIKSWRYNSIILGFHKIVTNIESIYIGYVFCYYCIQKCFQNLLRSNLETIFDPLSETFDGVGF